MVSRPEIQKITEIPGIPVKEEPMAEIAESEHITEEGRALVGDEEQGL